MKKPQQTNSNAAAATTLSFSPSNESNIQVGQEFPLEVTVDPGGQNVVSVIKLQIQYDPSKLSIESIQPANPPFTTILDGFKVSSDSASPNLATGTIAFGIGDNVTSAVQTATVAATVMFKALAATDQPTTVSLNTGATGQTQVLSLASTDNPGENVLSTTNPATITIQGGNNINPSVTPSTEPSPTIPTTPTPNASPVCSSLNVDRTPTGNAPFSLTFTANGTDSDGTISSVTFNFGDGPTQNITSGNGIGTNAISIPISHTYSNPGTYQATAVLTDNDGALSDPATCTKTITVSQASASYGGTGSGSGSGGGLAQGGTPPPSSSGSATVAPTSAPTTKPAPPVSGSTATTIGVIGGVLLTIIGGLLIFAL